MPDALSVVKSHSGNFIAGTNNAYTLTVQNTGAGTVTGTITPAQVLEAAGQGIAPGEFDKVVAAIRAGTTYANVHTAAFNHVRGNGKGTKMHAPGMHQSFHVYAVEWFPLDNVEAPKDDLRQRAAAQGAALIARGEGIHMGTDELFICSTSGGAKQLGQVFKLIPGRGGQADEIELFFESENEEQFNYGDNLTVGPNGHLIVCEDQYTDVVDNRLIVNGVAATHAPALRIGQRRARHDVVLQLDPAVGGVHRLATRTGGP